MYTRRRFLASSAGIAMLSGCSGLTSDAPDDAVQELPHPTRGDNSAPVTIGLHEDFGCPHCHDFNDIVLPKIESEYVSSGDALIEFYDFPVPVTDWSWPAAESARAVQYRSDDETFWTYAKSLYDNQSQLGHDLFSEAASNLSLDGESVVTDTKENRFRPVVSSSREIGEARGASGTPYVVVNGSHVTPSEDSSSMEEYGDDVLNAISDEL